MAKDIVVTINIGNEKLEMWFRTSEEAIRIADTIFDAASECDNEDFGILIEAKERINVDR